VQAMEFGRPSYFQGQPSTSKDSSSSTNSVILGSDETITGACWTGEKNLLVTSTSSVRVFHVDHVQEPLRTWNFRPDQQHSLTSAAVFLGRSKRTRSFNSGNSSNSSSSSDSSMTTPSILAIQNQRTLISWNHDDESLATLKSMELPASSNHLLSGFFPDTAIVVGVGGNVHCYNTNLQELGSSDFQVDESYSSSGNRGASKRKISRTRRRSNSSLSASNPVVEEEEILEWKVKWAKHAPIQMTREKIVVLLYVLLYKVDDEDANNLLVVHELTRTNEDKIAIKMISQNDLAAQVKAATLGVVKSGFSNKRKKKEICLQMICKESEYKDNNNDDDTFTSDTFQVLTFPNGLEEKPIIQAHQSIHSTTTKETKKTISGRKRTRRNPDTIDGNSKETSYSIVSISSRHSVIASVTKGGVKCMGWDSGFCVPINELYVPCHLEEASTSAKVQLMLCPDGVSLALIGSTTLVVFAIRCSEPSLSSVLGCGGGRADRNIVSLSLKSETALSSSFSRKTGQPLVKSWSLEKGDLNVNGRKESNALSLTLSSNTPKKFIANITNHLSSENPLLTHNYIRDVVGACHKYGTDSFPALKLIIETGRVSAWSCPLLVNTLLSSKTLKKKTKNQMKSIEKERIILLELTFLHVHDLHEDAIVRLLRYVISKSSVQYKDVNRLLHMIVATPYNGSFLRSFLRRLTISETRFMLKFLHYLIRVETQQEKKDNSSSSSSSSSSSKTAVMAQAVGRCYSLIRFFFF
jgi:hypothetical protein